MLASINPNEKTIVFCANQPHAALIRDLINQESSSSNVNYCARVTANDGLKAKYICVTFKITKRDSNYINYYPKKLSME
ncbi:MAG: hypothetical protein CM15mP123_09380 [Gammaproteobacteria bacterium]|nr:MAG: hypothetical protein CM15mP123_09380 [Gammaproteobacteria bacterium]